MFTCPNCGRAAITDGRCGACGARFPVLDDATIATIPAGALAGPQMLAETLGGQAATRAPQAGLSVATVGATGLGSLPPPEGPLRIGQSFGGRYHIIKLLGVGGMGAVYQAWDAELNVAVALKLIRSDPRSTGTSIDTERQFKNELLLARQVTHKNVVRIHDLGDVDGIKYITMPFVEGDDLQTVLRRSGALPVGRALRLARQIAGGLEAAHDAGVVHRDLKPANVMISGSGDDLQALIMDFGISASTTGEIGGGVIGTPEYMAPEQAAGESVDARADIYAVGLILYEMLTGPRPVPAPAERLGALKRRVADGLPPLRSIVPGIPEALASVVERCLQRDRTARYQTTAQLRAALMRLDDRGEAVRVPPRFGLRAIGAVAAALVGIVAGTWWVSRTPPPPAPHDPVSVVIADFQNRSNDPSFDSTLEPMLKLALEGASFITAYDRNGIRRSLGVQPPEVLDENAARELAVKQGQGVVLAGLVDRRNGGFSLTMKALHAVAGTEIASVSGEAAAKDKVLPLATRLASQVRAALGDDSSDTAQRFAMDTLSATSLDVVREYAAAMDALSNNQFDEARQRFGKAVELDPNFGLAYAGMAIASFNLDKQQDAERYVKEAVRHVDRMTERERFRTRGMYYFLTGDYQQCVKEYGDLIQRFAADAAAHNNLAFCSTQLRDLPRALDEMRQVVKILPRRTLYRANLALYADYAGEFQTGQAESKAAQDLFGSMARAFAQLGQGDHTQAAATYRDIEALDTLGRSYSASGLADLALYEGRFSDAVKILSEGAAADVKSTDSDRAAAKFAALAYARLQLGQTRQAVAAAEQALASSSVVKIRFLAGRLLAEAGESAKASALAAGLGSELQVAPRTYAKIIEGVVALKAGDARQAVARLTEANALLDTWIGRFDLGRAYLDAGAFPQADSEFDRCLKRRGEALALFLDEEPTFGYLPAVYYYQGRVRDGLKSAGAADSYQAYLRLREKEGEDPLIADVHRRIGT